MIEVAVIGAGAAGLAASRHLIGCGLKPSIFESAKHVGGAWCSTTTSKQGKMWDSMHTNLSKHSCCFSDFEWPASTPTYPSHAEMNRYLQDYSTTFIVDPTCFKFGCHVTHVKNTQDARYTVEWMEQDVVGSQSQEFDGVVVATGFFSQSYIPQAWNINMNTNININNDQETINDGWLIHSADYKSPQDYTNQTVAIVGSSFSALEIAVDVSQTASRVLTIVPSIPWVMPRYIPKDGKIWPVDLALYRRRQEAPQAELLELTPNEISDRHVYLKHLLGTRKQSAFGIPDATKPPFVVISDDFLNLVQQGTIEVVHGSVTGVSPSSHAIEVQQGKDKNDDDKASITTLECIDRVIACTGYRPQLDFLDSSILETLDYDPTDPFCPLTLAYDTLHPELPRLGFCGMYRASYFGVVELQARLLANLWSSSDDNTNKVSLDEAAYAKAMTAAKTIRESRPRAQMPHFDYIGCMDTLAEQLDLVPSKDLGGAKGCSISPPLYQPDQKMAQKCQDELECQGTDGSNVPRVVLNALVGKWDFRRTIRHFDAPDQQESVMGVIQYSKSSSLDYLLYREDGEFHYAPGKSLTVFREYEYIHKDGNLEIYFVETGKRADMFLSLKFTKQENDLWVATSDHLCIKDLYKGTFEIRLDGIGATQVTITYRVKGPQKDYESVTELRPAQ
jgi:dimethylaniline monooxygenase (N-oxide forming)